MSVVGVDSGQSSGVYKGWMNVFSRLTMFAYTAAMSFLLKQQLMLRVQRSRLGPRAAKADTTAASLMEP